MITEDTAGGDVYPIDALLGDVPERAFTGFFLVVGNQLRFHCMPPPVSSQRWQSYANDGARGYQAAPAGGGRTAL